MLRSSSCNESFDVIVVGGGHEVPVCDIGSIDQCDEDDEGVELENVTDDWYDEEGNLIP